MASNHYWKDRIMESRLEFTSELHALRKRALMAKEAARRSGEWGWVSYLSDVIASIDTRIRKADLEKARDVQLRMAMPPQRPMGN